MILRSRTAAAEQASSATAGPPATTLTGQFSPTKRNAFTVTATAHSDTGAAFVRETVVYLTGNRDKPYLFLWWGRGRR